MQTLQHGWESVRLVGAALLLPALAGAQQIVPSVPAPVDPLRRPAELVISPLDLEDGWLELVPMEDPEARSRTLRLGNRKRDGEELRLEPGIPSGVAMACSAGRPWGVLCEQIYLPEDRLGEDFVFDLEVRFEPGVAVTGRYLLADLPVPEARVAVVPSGLESLRPFTIPLGLEASGQEVFREVETDLDGRFELPELATGEYFLETILPSGRVHRSEPFELPLRAEVSRASAGGRAGNRIVLDLGTLDVDDGLVVGFLVTDPGGEPLANARVTGRQGDLARNLKSFEAWTAADGTARLAGFEVEDPVHLSCRKDGYLAFEAEYPLLPVLVNCTLEPLAAVVGELLGIRGEPAPGAAVTLSPVPHGNAVSADVAADGRFVVAQLQAGAYELTAAAPGFEVERRPVALEAGQRLDLGTLVLLAGREVDGVVVEALSRKPLVGVEIRSLSPPGAVFTTSDGDGAITFSTRTGQPLILELSAPEHATREVTLEPLELRSREPLEFTMERAGWIRALVWDEPAGVPCQSCRLALRPAGRELVTDGMGEALSEPLEPGGYRVYLPRITHLGSTVIDQPDGEYRFVRVERGRVSTVRFGERRRGVRVRFEPPVPAVWMLSARAPSGREKVRSAADGSFRVRHRRGVGLELYLHYWDAEAAAEAEVRQATLPPDFEGLELVVPLQTSRIEGRAESGGGVPLAARRVRLKTLTDQTHAMVHTRPDGSFHIPHVAPGIYALFIGPVNVHFVSLRKGQELDLGIFELIGLR